MLAASTGIDHADPGSVAVATARELAAAGARVALHLEELRVAHDPSGSVFLGAAIDRPAAWLPPTPWHGVVLTRALATVTLAPEHAGSHANQDSAAGAAVRDRLRGPR